MKVSVLKSLDVSPFIVFPIDEDSNSCYINKKSFSINNYSKDSVLNIIERIVNQINEEI